MITPTSTLGAFIHATISNAFTPTSILGSSTHALIDTTPHLHASNGMDTDDPATTLSVHDPSPIIIVDSGWLFPIRLYVE
jgi:hypothetical protein